MRSLGELSAVDVVQLSGRWPPARGRPLRPSSQLFLPPANAWSLGDNPSAKIRCGHAVGGDGELDRGEVPMRQTAMAGVAMLGWQLRR